MSFAEPQARAHTETHARHVASKVATDLKRLQRIFSGEIPTDEQIEDFQKEITLLLRDCYLGEVTYGFTHNNKWKFALKYRAVNGELINSGNARGGRGYGIFDVSGANFFSYLSYSENWRRQTNKEREDLESQLPFRRSAADEPGIKNGCWVEDRSYASGNVGVRRLIIEKGY